MSKIIDKINKPSNNMVEIGDILEFDNVFYYFAYVGKDDYRIINLDGTGYWDDFNYPEKTNLNYIQDKYNNYNVKLYKHDTIQLTIEQI